MYYYRYLTNNINIRSRVSFAALMVLTLFFAGVGKSIAVEAPVHMERGYADSRFGQIHYRIARPRAGQNSHVPLMALHLSPNSGQVFSSFLPLIGADRMAVAPDYPGYGMSDPIEGQQRIEDYAAAMLDVIEALRLPAAVDLLGYHTGTAVALEMARQRPDKVHRIMLVAVPVLTMEERSLGAALPTIPYDIAGEFAKEEWQRSWKWRGPGQSEQSVFATFSEKMRPGVRERGAKAILAYDIAPVLEAASHPLMIIRVRDDLWEASARARALRQDAKYLELPEYGHGLFHVAPQEMDRIARDFFDTRP